MNGVLLGTRSGVFWLERGTLSPLGLEDEHISAIYGWPRPEGQVTILAGSYGNGMFRREADGEWTPVSAGLTATAFRTIVPDPYDAAAILCGTEPGRIFRSIDGGHTWNELAGILDLPGIDDWYLPYSPRAGAVRNIYAPPETSQLFAAVEVGGLLRSEDSGDTWTCQRVLTDPDIHHITGHPHDPLLLYASLGWAAMKSDERGPDAPPLGGVARSRDGGETWTKLHTDYTRATLIPASQPDVLLAGPAKQVGSEGRIERSEDGGDTWHPAGAGFESPMEDMVELFLDAPDGSVWAMTSGGRLYRAEPGDWEWRSMLPADATVSVRSVNFLTGGM